MLRCNTGFALSSLSRFENFGPRLFVRGLFFAHKPLPEFMARACLTWRYPA
jgi:hypothetical protein